jgi:16S rRNA (adenine1518-N6/adenine1519-N6)-dimethyltransferase
MPISFKPFKKFGQNFLTNKNIAAKIVHALEPVKNEIIVEIGAGSGILTEILFYKNYQPIITLEIDPRFILNLQKRFAGKISIIQQDILDFSFRELYIKYKSPIKVIGNIPYNITSPILFKLIENDQYISQAILTVQKEIACRLLADPACKEYGILTILIGYHAKVQRLFNVKKENFYPKPKVDSTVIKIDMFQGEKKVCDYQLFRDMVHLSFNTRRKIMRNSLRKILSIDEMNAIGSVPLSARPEELSIQNFITLTNEISAILKKRKKLFFNK